MFMKILSANAIRKVDAYTIEHEPISDYDLMQRAAGEATDWLMHKIPYGAPVIVLAGNGNNGGDAFVIARLLAVVGYPVFTYCFHHHVAVSSTCETAKKAFIETSQAICVEVIDTDSFPHIDVSDWVIDGLFGSGLNRPLEGLIAECVRHVNESGATIVSIDVPSGLSTDEMFQVDQDKCIHATYTLTFQLPKLAFLFAEHELLLGDWQILNIGLHPDAIENAETSYFMFNHEDAVGLLHSRSKFAHKGQFGHALMIGGSRGMMGAVVLASRACLHSGVGLLTAHLPASGEFMLHGAVPEVLVDADQHDDRITHVTINPKMNAIGIGCGLGIHQQTAKVVEDILMHTVCPMVMDADALNLMSTHLEWKPFLSSSTIITPHPVEFDRLAGASVSSGERLQKARQWAMDNQCIVVLKGAYSAVIDLSGEVWFNTTGNPGMATAGSGDALTGIILAMLAQGYDAFDAARLSVYLHGLAGDIAATSFSQEFLTAGTLIDSLGNAFKKLREK
jgi:NAD(P)H-hydrate epimerase